MRPATLLTSNACHKHFCVRMATVTQLLPCHFAAAGVLKGVGQAHTSSTIFRGLTLRKFSVGLPVQASSVRWFMCSSCTVPSRAMPCRCISHRATRVTGRRMYCNTVEATSHFRYSPGMALTRLDTCILRCSWSGTRSCTDTQVQHN